MRKKHLVYNTASSLLYRLTMIAYGLILPRLIIYFYGSKVSGLVNSITGFLDFITLMEFGVGAVVQSAFYKPLAERDNQNISRVTTSATRFFRGIGWVFVAYLGVMVIVYPFFVRNDFTALDTAALIVVIGANTLASYFVGKVDQLLLTADQRGYLNYNVMTLTQIANAVCSVLLMRAGASIQMVKLSATLIYLLRPIALRIYVNRHYDISRNVSYDTEPIEQKRNGVAQHIACYVLEGTDIIVLTLFSSLTNVSIYSIYNLVIRELKTLLVSLMQGVRALQGELWARQELEELRKLFSWTEWIVHTGVVFIFGCTSVLIVPFVSAYTAGIEDASYINPTFALLLTLAYMVYCLAQPYHTMILDGNHYRQTQNYFIVAAAINLGISVLAVRRWGLPGVAVGTLVAMVYQAGWMMWYTSKELVRWPLQKVLRQLLVDATTFAIAYPISCRLIHLTQNYGEWIWMGLRVAPVWLAASIVLNLVFYRKNMASLVRGVFRRS